MPQSGAGSASTLFWLFPVAWTLLVALTVLWNTIQIGSVVETLARTAARSSYDKDVLFRRWASSHGGVYVPVTAQTPPNPYLTDVPERDLTTPSGRQLTLMNPAYMTRQVHELGKELYQNRGHITSLKPIRPANAPDPWEREALQAFERGATEVSSVEALDGEPHLRLMRPLRTDAGCLKCHASQGYREGEIRGGISVAVRIRDFASAVREYRWAEILAYSIIWALGLVTYGAGARLFRERRRAQLAAAKLLHQKEETHRLAMEAVTEGLWDWDIGSGRVDYSPAWGRILDEETVAPGYETWAKRIHPDDRAEVLESLREHLEGRSTSWQREHRLATRSGEWRWVLGRGRVIQRDEQGAPVRVVGTMQDISIRKRGELALKTLATSFAHLAGRGFFEAVCRHIGTTLGVDCVFVGQFNAGANTVSVLGGFARGEAMGDLTYALQGTPCNNVVGQLACVYPAGVRAKFPNDHLLVQMGIEGYLGAPIFDKHHQPIGILVALHSQPLSDSQSLVDLFNTFLDRVAAEMQRGKVQAALEKSEARQDKMAANIADVIVIIDQAGRNQYKSPNIEKWFGWRPEEVVGTSAFDNVHPDDRERMREFFGALQREAGATGTTECRYRCKDGSYRWIEFSGINLLHDPDIQGILGNYRDSSERKRLEEQFRQSQKMEAIGQLAGGVAHDFNNILAAMLMVLEMQRNNANLDPETKQDLGELEVQARRAASLTRQLLLFSRRSVMETRVVDLNAVVANLLKMLGRLLGEHIALGFEPGKQLPLVEADVGMLEQVLMNLAVNARDAMPEGGRITLATTRLEFSAKAVALNPERCRGQFVCLAVSDTGCGMDAATKKRVFEPFFTTKEGSKGTGLGLATVHGIVAQHRGWVEVESEVGQGTTFRVYLPASTQQALPAGPARSEAVPRGTETLLVVEDETGVRHLLVRTLRNLGYRVHEAADGREATMLWQAHGREIDLLFTDILMPQGISGLDLAERLKAEKPSLRIVISSGYSAETAKIERLTSLGAVSLPKPYPVSLLGKTVRQCLDQKKDTY